MAHPAILHNRFIEKELHLHRAITGSIIVVLLTLLLIARLFYLQVHQYSNYSTLSRNNKLHVAPIAAPRGLISDRNGVLLAKNISVFSLSIIPKHSKNISQTLKKLQKIISLTPKEIVSFIKRSKYANGYSQVVLKAKLSEVELAKLSVQQHLLPEMEIIVRLTREYPYSKIMAPILGYTATINYSGQHYAGKTGLEQVYETRLRGIMGNRIIETNAKGRKLATVHTTNPIPGENLQLTLDIRLQQAAYAALGTKDGAIVAMDPNNGNILALVSKPSYNPNVFSQGIDATQLQTLQANPKRSLFNKAISGRYPPASTIKPILALQGLDLGLINPKIHVYDPGWYRIPNTKRLYRDMYRRGHGWINLDKALTVSCDTYFYNLAHKMGIDNIKDILKQFGFGDKTGIDLPNESRGVLPSKAWKKRTKHQSWFHGDTVNVGIGQGYVSATPIQMAQVAAIFANKGKRFVPHIVQGDSIALPTVQLKNVQHFNSIRKSMHKVVTSRIGSARWINKNLSYSIAGKTGTAQVFSLGQTAAVEAKQKQLQLQVNKLRDHSWFIAFAPVQQPKIAIAVLVEHGKGSIHIARHILDKFFAYETTN